MRWPQSLNFSAAFAEQCSQALRLCSRCFSALRCLENSPHKTISPRPGPNGPSKAWRSAARDRAERAERTYAETSKAAAAEYQRGLKDGQDKSTAVAAGVRDGSLKLRKQWDCAPSGMPDYRASAAGPDTDDAAELRATDSGDLVRVGSDADTTVARLQAELIATRAACSGM